MNTAKAAKALGMSEKVLREAHEGISERAWQSFEQEVRDAQEKQHYDKARKKGGNLTLAVPCDFESIFYQKGGFVKVDTSEFSDNGWHGNYWFDIAKGSQEDFTELLGKKFFVNVGFEYKGLASDGLTHRYKAKPIWSQFTKTKVPSGADKVTQSFRSGMKPKQEPKPKSGMVGNIFISLGLIAIVFLWGEL